MSITFFRSDYRTGIMTKENPINSLFIACMLIAQNKLIGEKILTKNPYTLFIDHISMTINSTILYRRIS